MADAQYVPVDHDPFATWMPGSDIRSNVAPVDYDPFLGIPNQPSPAAQARFGRIIEHVGTGLRQWIEFPTDYARTMTALDGPRSEDESDSDYAMRDVHRQQLEGQAANWGAGTALGMIGASRLPGAAPEGAISAGGGRPPYSGVPDSLMGFRRDGQNKGFDAENYPHVQPVRVSYGDDVFEDSIKGLNQAHALERARRNWPGAAIEPIAADSASSAGIVAYHGSPHDFDAFDSSKIGTGEGAQSYGRGLYFAENKAVAEDYQRMAQRNADWTSTDPEKMPPGKLYGVSINADRDRFLDWDRPLSEQPQTVQDALTKKWALTRGIDEQSAREAIGDMSSTGNVVKTLEHYHSPKEISNFLRDAGIPGIKYLDQGSRIPARELDGLKAQREAYRKQGASEKDLDVINAQIVTAEKAETTHNFVVFDDSLISILKKYGLAGLSMVPPAVASQMRDKLTPVDHDPFAQ